MRACIVLLQLLKVLVLLVYRALSLQCYTYIHVCDTCVIIHVL